MRAFAFPARSRVATIRPDGHRFLLGKRQPRVLARGAGARIQGPALPESSAAFRSPGTQVAADAGDELPRPAAGVARRRLRGFRVARDPLLPGAEIARAAESRAH